MRHPKIILSFLLMLICASSVLNAGSRVETLTYDGEQMDVVLRQTAMPKLGQTKVENILTRYYLEGLGGPKDWEAIESLRVFGTLTTEAGEFKLAAYQKKPNFIKMKISSDARDLVLGYDGKVAWQMLPGSHKAGTMPDNEARSFAMSSHFGNHLLYPYEKGKTVTYINTLPVDGEICHQIRVTTASDFQIDYFIDVRTFLEIKVVNTDLRNNTVTTNIFKDYIREFGMPIAKSVECYQDGKWVSRLSIHEVNVNSGVMPWMFSMPK
ncbi:MAG: hypothetical protein ACSHX8_08065 [Opitutaceae bacterium]